MKYKTLALIFVMLLILPTASAVGLRAMNLKVEEVLIPGLELSQTYQIIVNSLVIQDYEVYAEGELAEYFSFNQTKFEQVAPGETPEFKVTFKFPENAPMPEPGQYKHKVVVDESLGVGREGTTGFQIKTSAAGLFIFRVMFPGKFAKISPLLSNGNANEQILMQIGVTSWGTADIDLVSGKIEILNKDGSVRETLETDSKPLPTQKAVTLSAYLDSTGYEPGEYDTKVTVNYDGEIITVDAGFKIGQKDINVSLDSQEINKAGIQPLEIKVESLWNTKIDNLFAEIDVSNSAYVIETATTFLDPWETKTLTAYLNTKDLALGEHPIKIAVNFDDEIKTAEGTITLVEPIKPEKKFSFSLNTTSKLLLGIGLGILLVVSVILMLRVLRRQPVSVPQR